LILFDTTLDTFRFAHLSVREFLQNRQEYYSAATNSLVAESCLLGLFWAAYNPAVEIFLSQYGEPLANRLPVWKDFRIYSTTYWARHCKLAATHRTEGVLKDFFEFFLSNESDPTSPLALWTSSVQKTLRHPFDFQSGERYPFDFRLDEHMQEIIAASAIPVFLACSFDFPEVIADQITRKGFRADYTNGKGHTALQVAVKFGSCEVITVMLNNGTAQITDEVVQAAARSDRGK
jgi:hypothetical protein